METSSSKRDIIVDLSQVAWKQGQEGNQRYDYRICLEGGADGPEAMQVRLPGMDVPPHFHHASQFQLLLAGSMQFSDRKMEALSVHYTDHDVPYGPFKPDREHSMLILHAKPGGYSPMSDKEARKLINSRGRELYSPALRPFHAGSPNVETGSHSEISLAVEETVAVASVHH